MLQATTFAQTVGSQLASFDLNREPQLAHSSYA